MIKSDILDLYTMLKRRKTSLQEWLDYNEINSIEDLDTKGLSVAGSQGCEISIEMKNDILEIFNKENETSIEDQAVDSVSSTTDSIPTKRKFAKKVKLNPDHIE